MFTVTKSGYHICNSYWLQVLLVFHLCVTIAVGQSTTTIEGHIFKASTREPVPYANIFNHTLQQGTLSNEGGFFRIPVSYLSDSIIISCVGYLEQSHNPSSGISYYEIFLEENIFSISEIVITPEENAYLYELLQLCKPGKQSSVDSSKAYFSLKTFKDGQQVELLESYYNATLQGTELKDLYIKTGRLAHQTSDGSFFVSLSSSKAIAMLKLFKRNNHFPTNPMELSLRKLKKSYTLALHQSYVDNNKDSIYVIAFFPKSKSGQYFRGSIWVNATEKYILKITLHSEDAAKNPFHALGNDKILKTGFLISKTFFRKEKQTFLNYIDFVYEVDYEQDISKSDRNRFRVRTESVLYFYDYNQTFFLPQMGERFEELDDYRQLSALPFIPFFWENHTEYKLDDSLDTNYAFFNDPKSITHEMWFSPKNGSFPRATKTGFYEHPFIRWSQHRIKISEMNIDTVSKTQSLKPNSDKYHFEVLLFMDKNTYKDSTHVSTAVIIDPFHSYYYLPVDTLTLCFANIYFDLCEIERRNLNLELETVGNEISQIDALYQNAIKRLDLQLAEFKKDVKRGTDISSLSYYNDYVLQHLEIDNMKLFGLKM